MNLGLVRLPVNRLLTSKYLNGEPEGSHATQGKSLLDGFLFDVSLGNIRKLNDIAEGRGKTLAQMAIAWVLRDEGITSSLISASKPKQVIDFVQATANLYFTETELAEIDKYAVECGINLWARSSGT